MPKHKFNLRSGTLLSHFWDIFDIVVVVLFLAWLHVVQKLSRKRPGED